MLYTKILNKLKDEKGLADKIAKQCYYASGSALIKSMKEKRDCKFHSLVKIVQTLFPNEERELLRLYAETVDPHSKNARCMLEYCEMNELHDTKRILINKMLNSNNAMSKEWACIYSLDDQFISKNITFLEALKSYGLMNPKSIEMKCMRNIFRAYCYLSVQDYVIVHQLITDIAPSIELVADEYMHDMIYGRYLLLMAESSMRKNDKQEARLYCQKLINDIKDKSLSTYGYLHLGNSLMLEGYDNAYEVLMTGYKLSELAAPRVRMNIIRSLNFLDNLYNKHPKFLNLESKDPSDVHELIFYYINHKQYTKATELLDEEIENVELSNNQLAFHWHLRGLITGEMKHFCNALTYFKKSGDMYFKEISIIQLKKLFNIEDCILELIAV